MQSKTQNIYCPSVSLYHGLPVLLNINHYHNIPAPPLSLTALPAFLSPLFVHVKYRTSEQVGRPGQARPGSQCQCDHVVLHWLVRYTSQPNHYLHFHSPAMT
jgi:hypothetical protein